MIDLYTANHPARFWRLLDEEPPPDRWEAAAAAASAVLPPKARGAGIAELLERTLGEGQFGPGHWRLPASRRAYYVLKPLLPRALILWLRRAHRGAAVRRFGLGWPVEDRYRSFLWTTVGEVLRRAGREEARFAFFWPGAATHALVLTHDVETADGQAWVPRLAEMEEQLGFRSSFNFVAEQYPLDLGLIRDLAARGFDVGLHGLRHDGLEFSSRRTFERRARAINQHLERLGLAGFRAPLTHRNPEWMQALAVEYDCSFFDTDPFEPIPGGTMSLWPFLLGHFVELPYTLPQDFTLIDILGERTPALWLEKASYVARWHGMMLVNSHPDYLRRPERSRVYEEFLEAIRAREGTWNALPREAARWWRTRATAPAAELRAEPLVHEGVVRVMRGEVQVLPPGALGQPRTPSGRSPTPTAPAEGHGGSPASSAEPAAGPRTGSG